MPPTNKSPFIYKGCTVTLTNGETLTILEGWGIKGFSVLNLAASTDNATINGGTDIGSLVSESQTIIPGGSRSWSAPNNGFLVGMIITAGASCTVQIQLLL